MFRAQLPPELLALAFNIVTELRHRSPSLLSCSSSALVLVAVLNLAARYTIDHPPKLVEWSKNVCNCRWTSAEIDRMGLQILSAVDWRLHGFSSPSAIQQITARFFNPAPTEPWRGVDILQSDASLHTSGESMKPGLRPLTGIKVSAEDRSAIWMNGLITPKGTPTEAGFDCVWGSQTISA